jgi:hypothetical protein
MRDAGMRAHLDAIGNVCGLRGRGRGSPCLMLGSYYDTVRDAGNGTARWADHGISCVAELQLEEERLPFAIEVTVRRRGGHPVRVHAVGEPGGRRNVGRERAWRKGPRRNLAARRAFAIRPRSRPCRSGCKDPRRTACLP